MSPRPATIGWAQPPPADQEERTFPPRSVPACVPSEPGPGLSRSTAQARKRAAGRAHRSRELPRISRVPSGIIDALLLAAGQPWRGSIGLPVLAADDQCGRPDSREIRPAARLAGPRLDQQREHLGVRPGEVVNQPARRSLRLLPSDPSAESGTRQRRGVPGEFRSATPSRVQAGRGLVARTTRTRRAGPAHLIRPHPYRHPRCTCWPGNPVTLGHVLRPVGEVPPMAGPGDEMAAAAAGRGPMRASHADREQVIEALKDAFAHGRADQGRTRRAGRSGAGRADLRRAGRAHRRHPARPGRVRTGPPAGPGPAPAAGQGGRPVGRLPGPRGRRRVGQLHPRSGRPRRRSPLGWPDGPAGPIRRNRGSVDLVVRGGHVSAAATLWQAVAAPAGAGRRRPRRRTVPWHRP